MKREISELLRKSVAVTPLECLILETDGPYVKPEKPETIAGKRWIKARNTSLILPVVASKIAEIKGVKVEDIIRITTENAKKLFKI